MKKYFACLGALALSFTAQSADDAHWSYGGKEGPKNWGSLSEAYKTCSSGKTQSPIDIQQFEHANLPAPEFDYRAGGTTILNNGHTLQVGYAPGSRMTVDGHTYELKQFHFHAPSENHIRGKSYPLEAHFVHADDKGHLAVIAVMIEAGTANSALSEAWSKIPRQAGEKAELTPAVAADDLMPHDRGYYRFDGSLTTPPCSEGVAWFVLKHPITASQEQIDEFVHAIHHPNNRPLQALNGRTVSE